MPAEFAGASEDGSKVFFLTEQELFAGNSTMNLYEYDFDVPGARKVVRVSIGLPTPEVQGVARVSEDGSSVYFVAKAVLTKEPRGGTDGPCLTELSPTERSEEELTETGKCRAQGGGSNLYRFERDAAHPTGTVTFIATLSESLDKRDWQTRDQRPVQATADGRFLVFESAADLTAGDASGEPQIFEYDAATEELVRVSIGQAGYAGGTANANTSGAAITSQQYWGNLNPAAATTELAVSADGSTVLFSSAGALTAQAEAAAEAGATSVYEYRSTEKISNGNVYLISDGVNTLPAEALGLDASAHDAFFETVDPLVPQDVDTQIDVYDARAGGGFPAPPPPLACQGEECQSAVPAQPSFGAAASASVPGGGNLPLLPAPPPPAPKVKPLTRAQKLAQALRACKRKPKRTRAACRAQAKKKYGAKTGRS